MNKNYIINLIDKINAIEINSIVTIIRKDDTHKYQVQYDNEFEDIELICLDEEDTIWGTHGDTIEELKEDLLCDGIKGRYLDLEVLEGDKL